MTVKTLIPMASAIVSLFLFSATSEASIAGDRIRQASDERCASALRTADPDAIFKDSPALYVRDPEGKLSAINAADIVCGAAHEMIEVRFAVRKGWFSTHYEIHVSPWSQVEPTLIGRIKPAQRADGATVWEVTSLPSLPGLDGPLQTLLCLRLSQQVAAAAGDAAIFGGFASIFLGIGDADAILSKGAEALVSDVICTRARAKFLR